MNDDTLFKAVRPNGTDFHTCTVQWAPPEGHEGEWIVRHPTATKIGDHASQYLSVSTVATDCTGMMWPCRLLTVEAVGDVTTPSPQTFPHKRAGVAFRVTGELPAHEAFGPQGAHVAALIERAGHLTASEMRALAAAGDAAGDAAWDAAWVAAWDAAGDASRAPARDASWAAPRDAARGAAWAAPWDAPWGAPWDAPWDAARAPAWAATRDATRALVVRDLITTDHYDTITRTWREAIGPIHPDDPDMRGDTP